MSRSSTAKPTRTARLLRHVYRYALVLVLACTAIIALIFLEVDQQIPVSDKLTQIGSGLAASIIFAIIYTVLANREFAELIRQEINGQLSDHVTEIKREMNQLSQSFLPTDQYAATSGFDIRFNRAVTHDLRHSNIYFFRGTSAKYIPARLRLCSHQLDRIQVILLDPRDRAAIDARARDRRLRPEYEGKQIADIASEIKNEILQALIALFDCRRHCEIEIGLSNITSSVRIEILDEAMYTSFYRAMESQHDTHPETARFSKESQIYQVFRDESKRQMQLAAEHRCFTISDDDDDLIEYLVSLDFAEISADGLSAQRQAYEEFIAPFSDNLRTIGVSG
jgi:hypothetical protein